MRNIIFACLLIISLAMLNGCDPERSTAKKIIFQGEDKLSAEEKKFYQQNTEKVNTWIKHVQTSLKIMVNDGLSAEEAEIILRNDFKFNNLSSDHSNQRYLFIAYCLAHNLPLSKPDKDMLEGENNKVDSLMVVWMADKLRKSDSKEYQPNSEPVVNHNEEPVKQTIQAKEPEKPPAKEKKITIEPIEPIDN